jgi:hypothetical protein
MQKKCNYCVFSKDTKDNVTILTFFFAVHCFEYKTIIETSDVTNDQEKDGC